MNNQAQYQALIARLDQFIRKYYLNQVIRGLLLVIASATFYFICIALLENSFYFGTVVRKIMFYSFLGLSFFTLYRWVISPGLKYFHLGKTISNDQAATIIGDHFPNVKDKLLNILQLNDQATQAPDNSLILAGIEQKTAQLRPVQFKSAIDLTKNKKYLRYALPPLILLLSLLIAAPSMIRNPADRLIRNNIEFERQAPFTFNIQNPQLKVAEFENFPLRLRLEGSQIPNDVTINVNGVRTNLLKNKDGNYEFTFANVEKPEQFHFEAAGFKSKLYTLDIIRKAAIETITIRLDYPTYTGRKNETIENAGDLIVPFGTKMTWQINTRNTTQVLLQFDGFDKTPAQQLGDQKYSYYKTASRDQTYTITTGNQNLSSSDSASFHMNVIADQNPLISLDNYVDSTNKKLVYLNGNVSDDYGISALYMIQQIKKLNGKTLTRKIPIQKPSTKQGFYSYLFDINDLKLEAGDDLNYYFIVYDNDAVKGPKSAQTQILSFRKPDIKELKNSIEESTKQVQDEMQKTLSESKKIQSQIEKLKEKLLQQKSLSWEDREQMQKLLEKQLALQEKMKQIQEKLQQKNEAQQELKPQDPEMKEKEEKMQDMMKKMENPEQDKMMERINELLKKLDKKTSLDQLDQMKKDNKEFNQSMERMMELLKQLELENKVQEQVDKLNELSEKQEKLSEKTEKNQDNESLKKEQEEIKKQFDEVEKKMDEIQKENKELNAPKKLDPQEESKEETKEQMEQSKENLQKKDNKSAAKNQKKAAQKMKQMAKQLESDMAMSQQEQIELDMKAIRQLLENIIGLSFTQEALITQTQEIQINTPRYNELMRDQQKIKTDFKMVDDSLQSLSKRVMQIESFILKKVGEVNSNLDSSLDQLQERSNYTAANHEQATMKNLNDLALMLSEVMQQMQMQASQSMPGNQMCSKPGGSNPKPGDSGKTPMDKITEGQQKLSDKMKQQKKDSDQGKPTGSGDFGQMASDQAKLRKMLQDLDNQSRQQGKGKNQGREDIMNAMDQIEKDLVNRRLTNEMILRQQQIMTRLLEEQRAERSQGQEEQRKANTAQEQKTSIPPSMEEYIRRRESGIDTYKTLSPALTPYYKKLVEQFYNQQRSK